MVIRSILLFILIVSSPTTASSSSNVQDVSNVAGIDLGQLREAGYRIEWVNRTGASGLKLPTIINNSLYVVDHEDYLHRFDNHSGKWLWSAPVGSQVFELRSITEILKDGIVYVVSDSAVFPLELATGNYPTVRQSNNSSRTVQHLPLKWVASTGAIQHNNTLIYGSSNGDAVWFNPSIGYVEHRYTIGSSVHVTPSIALGIRDSNGLTRTAIIASATDGTITAIDGNQITKIWEIKLLDAVETPVTSATNPSTPKEGEFPQTLVFIAGTDQYLRAIDLESGFTKWKVLTTSPLLDTPRIIGDSLYLRIPNKGLTCYDAFPDAISGELRWTAQDVDGVVITTNRVGHLVCWDSNKRILQVVDQRLGGVISTTPFPLAKYLLSDFEDQGSLYVITQDDMLLHLSLRR